MALIGQTLKKGEVYHLDTFYDLQGIVPNDCYAPCDEDGKNFGEDYQQTDFVLMLKTVEVKVKIKVLD